MLNHQKGDMYQPIQSCFFARKMGKIRRQQGQRCSVYEVVAGHRRWRACELAGLEEMPVLIRNLNDDEATIIMVDTNIQREDILPSEKARAYRMKYEAMKHQGSKGDRHTADAIGEAARGKGICHIGQKRE